MIVISNNAVIQNVGYTQAGLGTRLDVTFTLQKGLKAGDSIKFNFPKGFYFLKPTCFHRNSGSYTTTETLYNNRMLICQAFEYDMASSVPQTVSIIGIVNPSHSGFFLGSSLETMERLSPNILEKITVTSPIYVKPGSLSVNVKSTSLNLIVNTTHQFDILFENEVPMNSQVWIKIPPGFRHLAENCTLINDLPPRPNSNDFPSKLFVIKFIGEVLCRLTRNRTGYIIEGYSKISSNQLVSVLVNAENPPVPADYSIEIYSYSTEYKAKISEGKAIISIGSICTSFTTSLYLIL